MEGTTEELVARAQRGDREAFGLLIQRLERTALAIAYAVTGESAAAGDAVQEAFLRAWQRLAELDEPAHFTCWLARIVRNAACDQHRRRATRRESAELDHVEVPSGSAPSDRIERYEQASTVDAALAQLDELTRSAVVLKYYEGMASKQIALVLELTQGAVDMRLSRGRAMLKQMLSQNPSNV